MQEVGGSSPPVPTSLRGSLCEPLRLASQRVRQEGCPAEAASSAGVQRRRTNFFLMSQITVTLPDGSQRSVPKGTPVREFASGVLPQSVMKKAVAATVDGQLVDLTFPLDADGALRIVTPDAPEALPLLRHSTAHLLA